MDVGLVSVMECAGSEVHTSECFPCIWVHTSECFSLHLGHVHKCVDVFLLNAGL